MQGANPAVAKMHNRRKKSTNVEKRDGDDGGQKKRGRSKAPRKQDSGNIEMAVEKEKHRDKRDDDRKSNGSESEDVGLTQKEIDRFIKEGRRIINEIMRTEERLAEIRESKIPLILFSTILCSTI